MHILSTDNRKEISGGANATEQTGCALATVAVISVALIPETGGLSAILALGAGLGGALVCVGGQEGGTGGAGSGSGGQGGVDAMGNRTGYDEEE